MRWFFGILLMVAWLVLMCYCLSSAGTLKSDLSRGGRVEVIEFFPYEWQSFDQYCDANDGVRNLIVHWEEQEGGMYFRDDINTTVCDCYIPALYSIGSNNKRNKLLEPDLCLMYVPDYGVPYSD